MLLKKIMTATVLGIVTVVAFGCGESGSGTGGRIRIEALDRPPAPGVDNVWVTVETMMLHSSEAGWDTIPLVEANTRIDFLELVNGVTAMLVDAPLAAGTYSQLRIIIADSSEIVVDGETFDLVVPSGTETGAKLNMSFTVESDELVEVMLDLDLTRSIHKVGNRYFLKPVFKTWKKVLSGTIAGTVTDTSGAGLANVAILAIDGPDTSYATLTSSSGGYKLVVLAGTYDIEADIDSSLVANASYPALSVAAEEDITGKDFIME